MLVLTLYAISVSVMRYYTININSIYLLINNSIALQRGRVVFVSSIALCCLGGCEDDVFSIL